LSVWIDRLHDLSELECVNHMFWISMLWLEEKEHGLGSWMKMLVSLTIWLWKYLLTTTRWVCDLELWEND